MAIGDLDLVRERVFVELTNSGVVISTMDMRILHNADETLSSG
jgi:hypothetical protein